LRLVEAARKRGIDRIIVTHPHMPFVGVPMKAMKELAAMGAYLEFVDFDTFEHRAAVIREVGIEHCFLSTDGGTTYAPPPVERFSSSIEGLAGVGFTAAELSYLSVAVPNFLLGRAERPVFVA
jgi:hypothetical protein